jgi:hypothetical protein
MAWQPCPLACCLGQWQSVLLQWNGWSSWRGIKETGRLTSGLPFGSRNSSGTIFLICVFLSPRGGDGLALYSVRERLLKEGVLGSGVSLCDDSVCACGVLFSPLIAIVSSMLFARHNSAVSEEAMFTGTQSIIGVSWKM